MFLLTLKDRKDDGAFAVEDDSGDKVLFLFEQEDDAERYAMMINEQDVKRQMDIIEVEDELALKTCKTQTGALLSLCWARAHGMTLMVQDLTNPMLAQIPHVLLAAHAGTIMGVETNSMQFYPEASDIEAVAHPGVYSRQSGELNLSSLSGSGFGYQVERINRNLPKPVE